MNNFFFCISVSFLMITGSVAHANPDTLEIDLKQVLKETLAVSPDIQAAMSNANSASARYQFARSSRVLPNATASTSFSAVPGIDNPNGSPRDQLYLDPAVRNDFSNLKPFALAEFSLIQPIYTWGALGGSIKAASAGADLEDARAHETMLSASLRAAEFYYNVLLAQELSHLAGRGQAAVNMAIQEINRLLDEGSTDIDDADRYQILITQQEFERRVVEVSEKRQTAHAALRRQLMLSDSIHIAPAQNTLAPMIFVLEDLEYYQQKALMYRPEILQAKAGLSASSALVQVARSDYYPQSGFGITFSIGRASNRFRQPNPFVHDTFRRTSVRAGIRISQKLNFGQTRAKVAQAEAQHSRAQHLSQGAEQQILAEIEQAWRQVAIEEAALAAKDSSLTISKQWLRVEQVNFDLDLGNTENLLNAVQTNLTVEADYYEAVSRYNMAILKLLSTAGILIREMDSFLES